VVKDEKIPHRAAGADTTTPPQTSWTMRCASQARSTNFL